MTPYKGIVRITCTRKKCDQYKAIARATPLLEPAAECVNCEKAAVEILDLNDKTVARLEVGGLRRKPQPATTIKNKKV